MLCSSVDCIFPLGKHGVLRKYPLVVISCVWTKSIHLNQAVIFLSLMYSVIHSYPFILTDSQFSASAVRQMLEQFKTLYQTFA